MNEDENVSNDMWNISDISDISDIVTRWDRRAVWKQPQASTLIARLQIHMVDAIRLYETFSG